MYETNWIWIISNECLSFANHGSRTKWVWENPMKFSHWMGTADLSNSDWCRQQQNSSGSIQKSWFFVSLALVLAFVQFVRDFSLCHHFRYSTSNGHINHSNHRLIAIKCRCKLVNCWRKNSPRGPPKLNFNKNQFFIQ